MKYKWKDKVRIKSKKELECISEVTDDMLKNGGAIMTIACLVEDADGYIMKEDGDFHFLWSDEMIEGLVEEETKPNITEEAKTYWDSIKDAWICPEGYIFKDENGNVINATKIVLEKKKKEYPKSYEECCEILDVCSGETLQYGDLTLSNDYEFNLYTLLENFRKLLICRDAYWKLYGEEMGLDKPWEPDWTYNGATKYCIGVSENKIQSFNSGVAQYIFAFPTPEMRDAFYENFKEEIEQCKELL